MCDYSLQDVPSRPAKVGDRLVSIRFRNSFTGGLATINEPNVAICLLPGTELAFDAEVESERAFRFLRKRKIGHKVARFRQLNVNNHTAHHDALEFPGGATVLVNELSEGQVAKSDGKATFAPCAFRGAGVAAQDEHAPAHHARRKTEIGISWKDLDSDSSPACVSGSAPRTSRYRPGGNRIVAFH